MVVARGRAAVGLRPLLAPKRLPLGRRPPLLAQRLRLHPDRIKPPPLEPAVLAPGRAAAPGSPAQAAGAIQPRAAAQSNTKAPVLAARPAAGRTQARLSAAFRSPRPAV